MNPDEVLKRVDEDYDKSRERYKLRIQEARIQEAINFNRLVKAANSVESGSQDDGRKSFCFFTTTADDEQLIVTVLSTGPTDEAQVSDSQGQQPAPGPYAFELLVTMAGQSARFAHISGDYLHTDEDDTQTPNPDNSPIKTIPLYDIDSMIDDQGRRLPEEDEWEIQHDLDRVLRPLDDEGLTLLTADMLRSALASIDSNESQQ